VKNRLGVRPYYEKYIKSDNYCQISELFHSANFLLTSDVSHRQTNPTPSPLTAASTNNIPKFPTHSKYTSSPAAIHARYRVVNQVSLGSGSNDFNNPQSGGGRYPPAIQRT
jgi:hypothetical protein